MHDILCLCAVLLCAFATVGAADAAPSSNTIYVSPNGNDAWSGKLPAANRGATDGPLRTPQHARDLVRALLAAQQGRREAVTVVLRGGAYPLTETLEFTPRDSGTQDAPVTWKAFAKEEPQLSGGAHLKFTVGADGHFTANVPEAVAGNRNFSQLFVNDQRRYRTRLPETGYYEIAADSDPTPESKGKGYDVLAFAPGVVRSDWHNLDDVEILAFHVWTMSRMRIKSVDDAANRVTFTGPTSSMESWAALPKGHRFLVENVKEALKYPGQWYLDRKTGVLEYIPMPGETPETTDAVMPVLETLVRLQGDIAARDWVQHLRFEGINFAESNWNTPPAGDTFAQAAAHLGAAVTAEGARDVQFVRCRVRHTGAWAIDLRAGCRSCLIDDCELSDLGAGGVKIGEMRIPADKEAVAAQNQVTNCAMVGGGRLNPAATGVWVGHSYGNRIAHNDILDFYYTGISVGWSWGYGESLAHDNIVEFNRIDRIGQGVLSDMGGIYTLGISPNTVLRNNFISNVKSFDYGAWGIYPDEGSTGMLVENNIVFQTKTGSFHQHYGKENRIVNNIFAFSKEGQIIRTRAEDHLSFTMQHNIVIFDSGTLLGSNWEGNQYALDDNIYWRTDGKPVEFNGKSLEKWREKGHDLHSLVADPLFVDAQNGDFRLKPGSPALKLGFRPIDLKSIGRPGRHVVPNAPPAFPLP